MKRYYSIAITTIVLLLAFCFQGSRGIFAPDEGFYVGIAKEMMDSGDFVVPRLSHEPWLDKPPVTMWMSAVGMMVLGQNEWGARIFQSVCYSLTALFVFLLGLSMGRRREGLLAALIYATMLAPFIAANVVTPDTPLALCVSAAYLFFWKSTQSEDKRQTLWKLMLSAMLGLGFLTKGPAMLVYAMPMIAFLAVRRNLTQYFRSAWTLVGIAVFAIVGLSWYAMVSRLVPGALAYFWDNQVWGRTVSAEYHRNPGIRGAFIYLPTLLLGTLPWSLKWVSGFRRCKTTLLTGSWWRKLSESPADLLFVCWIAVSVAIFASASSKLPLYVLPVFPALALVTARGMLSPRDETTRVSQLQLAAVAVLVVSLLGLKLYGATASYHKDMRALNDSIKPYLPAASYEIVCVNQNLEGLYMYQRGVLENATTSTRPYKFFIRPESLKEEVSEMASTHQSHLFLAKTGADADILRKLLKSAGCSFSGYSLPYGRVLIVCYSVKKNSNNSIFQKLAPETH